MPNRWKAQVDQEAKGLERLLTHVLALEPKVRDRRFSRLGALILARINRLYFADTGVTGFLRRAARGQHVPQTERIRLRADHHSFEAEFERAADILRREARRRDVKLDVDALALLDRLVDDSSTIRRTVRGMIDLYEDAHVNPEARKDDADYMLARVERLAPRFLEAETRLREHARARR